jgi:hypothetical protein
MGRLCLAWALGALAFSALAADASADTVWLCNPVSPNPCNGSLEASLITPAGQPTGRTVRPGFDPGAPIDCFYVYPTVSEQPGPLANLDIDQAQRSIALYQAAPFSSVCRVYAPMYRQLTLAAINAPPGTITAQDEATAYGDVRAAWRDYLRHQNHGRGVVFIGHSQGTFILRQLIRREVDRKPAVRRKLVGALLLGGNVTVAKGQDVGGDFRRVPACRRTGQIGCVVAYSTFDQPVPAAASFGRTTTPGQEVLCTNPASLRGGSGLLTSAEPTTPFGGTIGAAIDLLGMRLPAVTTPWVISRGAYSARCSDAGGADVLQVTPLGGAPLLNPVPTAGWGLHLADMNLPMMNLVAIVRAQSRSYMRSRER